MMFCCAPAVFLAYPPHTCTFVLSLFSFSRRNSPSSQFCFSMSLWSHRLHNHPNDASSFARSCPQLHTAILDIHLERPPRSTSSLLCKRTIAAWLFCSLISIVLSRHLQLHYAPSLSYNEPLLHPPEVHSLTKAGFTRAVPAIIIPWPHNFPAPRTINRSSVFATRSASTTTAH